MQLGRPVSPESLAGSQALTLSCPAGAATRLLGAGWGLGFPSETQSHTFSSSAVVPTCVTTVGRGSPLAVATGGLQGSKPAPGDEFR